MKNRIFTALFFLISLVSNVVLAQQPPQLRKTAPTALMCVKRDQWPKKLGPRKTAVGYQPKSGPGRRYDRSTPESRPSSGSVRFLGVEVRSTSDSRRRRARSARTGFDPNRTC